MKKQKAYAVLRRIRNEGDSTLLKYSGDVAVSFYHATWMAMLSAPREWRIRPEQKGATFTGANGQTYDLFEHETSFRNTYATDHYYADSHVGYLTRNGSLRFRCRSFEVPMEVKLIGADDLITVADRVNRGGRPSSCDYSVAKVITEAYAKVTI